MITLLARTLPHRRAAQPKKPNIASIHHFELRKGGLGFYQLNMAPVYAVMKEFYREHQAQTQQRIGLT